MASFSSFVFDPDDSVQQRVFQCACGASIPADRTRALLAGWRRTWIPGPYCKLAAGEPSRPSGLLLTVVSRKWSCPDCTVPPTESYDRNTEEADQTMPTKNILLFPAHVLGVRVSSCTAPKTMSKKDPRGKRIRLCAPGEWIAMLPCLTSPGSAFSTRILVLPKRRLKRCVQAKN